MIPEKLQSDMEILKGRGFDFDIIEEGLNIYIKFKNFPLPTGLYNMDRTDLLIFTTPHYPNACLDMFWTDPGLALKNGSTPNAADTIEQYLGKSWRRFSYHPYNNGNSWDPSKDSVATFIQYVQQRLQKGD